MSEGWELGIDFGTSYTVAAVATARGVAVLDIESNGQTRMPSSVFYTENDEVLVGSAARHQSAFAPERYEATPKRSIADGELFLGDTLVAVTTLIAGVLRKVFGEAQRQQGGTAPTTVRVTHPAGWGGPRLDLLREAAVLAGLPDVALVPEPVAAAAWIAGETTAPGDLIAVYDFGGGTFDAAVLRRTDSGFVVAGPPAGRDPLGGEDIDRRIVDYIATIVGDESPEEWDRLVNPRDVTWRRRFIALRAEVQRAKETLSEVTSCQLWIPGLERELQLTRPELEAMIATDLESCTETLLTALADASVIPAGLQGLYLVGGSSRIPAVADGLWRRLGIVPTVQDSPKSVVSLGAARWGDLGGRRIARGEPSERWIVPAAETATVSVQQVTGSGEIVVAPTIVVTLPDHMIAWRSGVTTSQTLERVTDQQAEKIRVRDEPSRRRDVEALAARAGDVRSRRSPGYLEHGVALTDVCGLPGVQRDFSISLSGRTVRMVERYVVAGGRALVLAFPAEQTELADSIAPAGWPATNPMTAPVLLPCPSGWTTSELIRLAGPDGVEIARAERALLPGEPIEAWRWHRLEPVLSERAEAGAERRVAGMVLGTLPGEIVTVRWRKDSETMLTELGTASASGQGFVTTVTLPIDRQAEFATFTGVLTVPSPVV